MMIIQVQSFAGNGWRSASGMTHGRHMKLIMTERFTYQPNPKRQGSANTSQFSCGAGRVRTDDDRIMGTVGALVLH